MKIEGLLLVRRLGLSDADLAALAEQGYVAADYCLRGGRRLGPYFKLRWRRAGRQQVRYLGSAHGLAEAIRAELARLQAPRQLHQQRMRQVHLLCQEFRQLKRQLELALAERGLYLHGYTVRRRTASPPAN